jgi:hypothetical protein
MTVESDPAFDVRVGDDGSVTVSGKAAVSALLTITLAAKFPDGPKTDVLLSPFVHRLVEALTREAPMPPSEWTNPAIETPHELLAAVEAVRGFQKLHRPDADLIELVRLALEPFDVPLDRLGLAPDPLG